MSDGFEKLQAIGAQKIHEKTHIAKQHVQALLHESFDQMTKVQFIGFLSILEREYSVDLSAFKQKGLEYFKTAKTLNEEDNHVFITTHKKKNYTLLYIGLSVLLLSVAVLYSIQNEEKTMDELNSTFEKMQEEELGIKEEKEENVAKTLLEQNSDSNSSLGTAQETQIEEEQVQKKPSVELQEFPDTLQIIPNARLWIGYIDANTHQKFQTTTSEAFELDPKKDWLLTMGHGDLSVVVGEEKIKFTQAENLRLLYKEGVIKEIDSEEFKSLNRGDRW